MSEKIKIGISACLLGEKVRYDGQHKLDRFLRDTLGQYVEWVPVCPEVACGLPVPRESMHLAGTVENPRLITTKTRIDHTAKMQQWINMKIPQLAKQDFCGFVFKSKSPSSGMSKVKIYTEAGMPYITGSGLFAKAFMLAFPNLPVEDEGRLHDPRLRENFLERVFIMHRWQQFISASANYHGLIDFHTKHKLLIMAHSPAKLKELGQMVANGKRRKFANFTNDYLTEMMKILQLSATTRKNTNVLQHVMGYFKKVLSPDEKLELLKVINDYHQGSLPLIVPIVLLQHYVRKYSQPYLQEQFYLNPHPLELKLRNYA